MATELSKEKVLVIILIFIVIASGLDLFTDLSHGAPVQHIIKEAVVVLFSVLAIFWLLGGLRQQALEIEQLKQELHSARHPEKQPDEYVLSARRHLSEVIAQQFTQWELTESEKNVGWLLLKGLSLKEIALLRSTLEKTVRQQASAIYKKAGLPGRHAFSAWFIEELL